MKKDRVLIIDGLNSIFRVASIAFAFAKPDDKLPYTIVYSFFRSLRLTVETLQPTKIFFCLEGKDNFRYKIFPEYKGNRIVKTGSNKQSFYEEVGRQKDIIVDILSNLPITVVDAVGYEGDDIVASLVDHLKDEEIIILSGDTDFIQLLQNGYSNLTIYSPIKKEFMKSPDYHYKVWKILKGDKSDNIPGIVGPKKAEEIASDPEKLTSFLKSEENRANFNLNKELIELKIIDINSLIFKEYKVNLDKVKEHFIAMDFNSMIEEKYWNRFVNAFSF